MFRSFLGLPPEAGVHDKTVGVVFLYKKRQQNLEAGIAFSIDILNGIVYTDMEVNIPFECLWMW